MQLLLTLDTKPENTTLDNRAPLCACGICNQKVTWNKKKKKWNRYIQGHQTRNKDNRNRMSLSHKKRYEDNPEYKKTISNQVKEMWQDSEYREKMSKSKQSLEYRENKSNISKKLWQNPEYITKVTIGHNDPKVKEKKSKTLKDMWQKPEHKEKMELIYTSTQYREKRSKIAKILWDNPQYKEMMIAKLHNAVKILPNKPETIINMITSEDIQYTGNRAWWKKVRILVNGEYVVKSKNPDFKVKNQNKVIEVFGTYWHKDDNPDDLINAYKEAGLDCLVIWEHDISSDIDMVLNRIAEFIGETKWQMTLL